MPEPLEGGGARGRSLPPRLFLGIQVPQPPEKTRCLSLSLLEAEALFPDAGSLDHSKAEEPGGYLS